MNYDLLIKDINGVNKMAFQLSPGVLVREIDLTQVVPAVATLQAPLLVSFNGDL